MAMVEAQHRRVRVPLTSVDSDDRPVRMTRPGQDFRVEVFLSRDLALAELSWGISDPDSSRYVPGQGSGKGIRVGYDGDGNIVAIEILTDEVDIFRSLAYRVGPDHGDPCSRRD